MLLYFDFKNISQKLVQIIHQEKVKMKRGREKKSPAMLATKMSAVWHSKVNLSDPWCMSVKRGRIGGRLDLENRGISGEDV